ncbi:MAG: regulatory signaling modulator protein AmpE [Gammaproteobacteria bacterium]|nr:regulatory signaling modulator protein AmpE [Gammaproteobacteria bacterium]
MSLLIIILGLITERFLGELKLYRRFDWFATGTQVTLKTFKKWPALNSGAAVVALLLIIALISALLFHALYKLSPLLWFVAAGIALVYSLGPKTFYDDAKTFSRAFEAGDTQAAYHHAQELFDRPLTEDESRHIMRSSVEALLVAANDRLFGTLFWFIVAGPVGALMYRLSSHLAHWAEHHPHREEDEAFVVTAEKVHFFMKWAPTHLLALSYGLAGNFSHSLAQCRVINARTCSQWKNSHDQIIICAGLGALGKDAESLDEYQPENIGAALALIRRSAVLWLMATALLTLAGILS